MSFSFCFKCYGDHRELHVLTHSFPTRRSSDLSLGFGCERMEGHLERIQRGYGEEAEAGRMAAALCRARLSGPIQSIFDGGLHEYLRGLLTANAALAGQVERDYRFVE